MQENNISSLEKQALIILRLLPQPKNKPELNIWIHDVLNDISKAMNLNISITEISNYTKSILEHLEKKSSYIANYNPKKYYPLSIPAAEYDGVTEKSESQIFKYLPMITSRVIDIIDSNVSFNIEAENLVTELTSAVQTIVNSENIRLNYNEIKIISHLIATEITGFGPLEILLNDSNISDILVNGIDNTYIEKNGLLIKTELKFRSEEHLLHIIKKIANSCGRNIDHMHPYVDARLPNGSRVNAIIPPIAIDAPTLSIRKFNHHSLSLDQLVKNKAMTPVMAGFLSILVNSKMNIIISGGTGSGKTTLLNALSWAISNKERIITIEDSAELRLQQDHVVRLETRNKNIDGEGEITQRKLLINALRMRPDRIIIGEVRGKEAFDMLQAMNTGHEGSMSTIHANSPDDAIARLVNMLSMAENGISEDFAFKQIGSIINIIVQASRMSDGKRKVTEICQVYFDNSKKSVATEPLFYLEQQIDSNSMQNSTKFIRSKYPFRYKDKCHGMQDFLDNLTNKSIC